MPFCSSTGAVETLAMRGTESTTRIGERKSTSCKLLALANDGPPLRQTASREQQRQRRHQLQKQQDTKSKWQSRNKQPHRAAAWRLVDSDELEEHHENENGGDGELPVERRTTNWSSVERKADAEEEKRQRLGPKCSRLALALGALLSCDLWPRWGPRRQTFSSFVKRAPASSASSPLQPLPSLPILGLVLCVGVIALVARCSFGLMVGSPHNSGGQLLRRNNDSLAAPARQSGTLVGEIQMTNSLDGQPQGQEARAAVPGQWSLPNRPSLFSVIRFPNEECFDSSNQSGTCYTAFECKLLGGQPSSPCAAGFGSCCIVSRTCHVSTREKVVYFKNPSYPSTDSSQEVCDLTVEMSDVNVCQLRLDFLDFQLDPPTNGACQDDYMEISASGMPPQAVPRLCGLNRNQHLYINLPQDLSERAATIVFYTDAVGDHRWQVKVTQIDCNQYRPLDWKRHYAKLATSPLWNPHPNGPAGNGLRLGSGKYSTTFASGFQAMSQTASALAYELLKPQFTPRAPMGCLQYFTQPSGIIESFNFGQYLNNMDYSICIQRQPDTCRVVFTSSDYDWSLNGVGVAGSSSGVGDQDCARDYLLIPGASRTGDGFTYDRYCGGRLNYYRGQSLSAPVVIKTSGPIVLRFHSDAHFETVNNGGFRLQYDQSTQDCIYHTAEEAGSLASQQLVASTLSDSRPYVSSFAQDAPALYSSHQLGTGPTVQQLQHVDFEDPSQHHQPMKALTSSLGATNKTTLAELQQQVSLGANQIKRRQDSDDHYNGEQVELENEYQSMADKRRRPSTIQPQPSGLSLGDLSKAFQLITARNARAMRLAAG